MIKNYEVIVKCGHVGKGYFIAKSVPVLAGSKSEAAKIARQIPRVKHHHKYAIIDVIEVDDEEFVKLEENYHHDPYMQCKNIQEQRMSCGSIIFEIEIDDEDRNKRNKYFEYDKQERRERIAYKRLKNRYKYDL